MRIAGRSPNPVTRPRLKPSPRASAKNKAHTPDLPGVLEAAGRVRRGPGPEGSEPLLTGAERDRLTKLFAQAPAARARALAQLVSGVPDGPAKALMLKAIAARAERLTSDDRPLNVLQSFAQLMREMPTAQLLEDATVIDLDSTVSTSSADLMPTWNKRGTIRGAAPNGQSKDNDGLLQRFTASCGPTVIQLMRAQTDPVLAFAINRAGRTSDSTTDAAARFQRLLLEEYGGIAVGRRESYVLARLHNAFARLGLATRTLSAANIAVVRARYDGFPSDEDLARVRAAVTPTRDEGIGFEDFEKMLDRYVGRVTGANYRQTSPPEGFARGQAWRHLDSVTRSLKRGFDVPVGLSEPAHWMLITDVRQRGGGREFLVSDPDGGRTDWVPQKALVDGTFAQSQFHLADGHERPYVDSFFLPAQ